MYCSNVQLLTENKAGMILDIITGGAEEGVRMKDI